MIKMEEILNRGWWYMGGCSRTTQMADGSPRIQIDAGYEMIDTEGYNNFAKAARNQKNLLLLVIPLDSEFAKDLVEELRVIENDRKKEDI